MINLIKTFYKNTIDCHKRRLIKEKRRLTARFFPPERVNGELGEQLKS